MYPTLHLGPAAIQTQYVIVLLGAWLALEVAAAAGFRRGLPTDFIQSAGFWALIGGLVGARLGYVLLSLDAYRHDPGGLFSPRPGTFNTAWGVIVGALVLLGFVRRRGLPLRPVLDAFAPGIGVLLVTVALGDLANGDTVGLPSDAPWAVDLWYDRRHPVPLYIALPVLGVALWTLLATRLRPFPGFDFLAVVGVYALAVLVSSTWREFSETLWQDIRREQVVAWLALLGVTLLGWAWARGGPESPDQSASEPR